MSISRLCTFIALLVFGGQAAAQSTSLTTLVGVRHAGPGAINDSNATFAIGMSRDGGATFVTTAFLTDTVQIRGEIRAEAANVGQMADIFVVDRLSATEFNMRTQDGVWVPWNGNVAALVPFKENEPLDAVESVEMFTGQLGQAGLHRMFIGYLPPDGILRYNVNALPLTIEDQNPLEAAQAIFASSVSPSVVQTVCIECHVSGGLADGQALHTFVSSANANHLSINFSQFQSLLNARGKGFILDKVQGGQAHGGGFVLSPSSQEYQDLDTFLTLLEDL